MRVLVSAASKHGATDEIAHAIAAELREAGIDAVEIEPTAVTGIEHFDAAILGSAVYAGHWLDPMTGLVERDADALVSRPVWLFSSGPLGTPPRPDEVPVDGTAIAARIGARGHMVFAGRLDRARLGLGEKAIASFVRAPEGDFRPWADIRAWAASIAAELAFEPATAA